MRISSEKAKQEFLKLRKLRNNLQIKFLTLDSDANHLKKKLNSFKIDQRNESLNLSLRQTLAASWVIKRQLREVNRQMNELQKYFSKETNQLSF